jgi:hypothetical protein
MNRADHLQWCKDRAMKYVEAGDFPDTIASMLSDLGKHPDTKSAGEGIGAQLGLVTLMTGPTRDSVTRFIQGFL